MKAFFEMSSNSFRKMQNYKMRLRIVKKQLNMSTGVAFNGMCEQYEVNLY